MNIRPKPVKAPLGKTLKMVGDTAATYGAFGDALWAADGATPATLKELVFIRTSIVNQCPT